MTSIEDLPNSFFIPAILTVFIASSIGVSCNLYLFSKFAAKKKSLNGFQKICVFKSLANLTICSSFLFWAVPISAFSLSLSDVNYDLNRLFGLVAGTEAFFLSALMGICTSCNRFFVLQFPFGIESLRKIPVTSIAIGVSIALVTAFSAATTPAGCGFIYDPDLFVWRPEFSECSQKFALVVPLIIVATTIITNMFNVAIIARLMMLKISGLKKADVDKRRKRWKIMFIQSIVQDCLQLVQVICSYFLYKLSDAIWYRFLCMTLSFIMATTCDGLVMFICQVEFHPSWMKHGKQTFTRKQIIKLSIVSSRNCFRKNNHPPHGAIDLS